MLNVKLKDRILTPLLGKRTRSSDTVQYVTDARWKWTGHITPM